MSGNDDWLWDGSGTPDPDTEKLADALGSMKYNGEAPELPNRRQQPAGYTRPIALAAAVLLAIGIGSPFVFPGTSPDGAVTPDAAGWELAALGGCPDDDCELVPGEWLETDSETQADLKVANIGYMRIKPDTRLRLVATGEDEHRLELAQGVIQATVDAPPRLLVVETPSATAVDLGCAYELAVAEDGSGSLHVTSGWVALETETRDVIVPAGAMAETVPGRGPLTPYFPDASDAFREQLAAIEWGTCSSERAALDILMEEARPRDTLSLWHLIPMVSVADRGRLYDRIHELDPEMIHNQALDRQGVLDNDERAMRALMSELQFLWFFPT